MLTRRSALGLAALGAGAAGLAACGGDPAVRRAQVELVAADVPRAAPDPALVRDAARSVQAFGADLYGALRGASGNVLVSPWSVAVALAMTREGARGATARAFASALHLADPARASAGVNALQLELARRAGPVERVDGTHATVDLTTADAVWAQRGMRWEPAFLDALARWFGAGVRTVDFADPAGVTGAVNAWASKETRGLVRELLPAGVLTPADGLVLADALHLKAPWEQPFEKESTRPELFTRGDGSRVRTPMMSLTARFDAARGDGWTAARLPYAGGQLALTVVLPDRGRLDAVERSLAGGGIARLLAALRPAMVGLQLPRWSARVSTDLKSALTRLGLGVAFSDGADFSGMTTQQRLEIGSVRHQAVMTTDEEGTEAAAATAVVMRAISAPAIQLSLVADRPFLVVLHDVPTGVPLFLGRVSDPAPA